MINIENKKDLISLDLRLKEIRYVKNNNIFDIQFIPLSNNDILGYEYLFNNAKSLFFKTLKFDIKSNLNIDMDIKKLREVSL